MQWKRLQSLHVVVRLCADPLAWSRSLPRMPLALAPVMGELVNMLVSLFVVFSIMGLIAASVGGVLIALYLVGRTILASFRGGI